MCVGGRSDNLNADVQGVWHLLQKPTSITCQHHSSMTLNAKSDEQLYFNIRVCNFQRLNK